MSAQLAAEGFRDVAGGALVPRLRRLRRAEVGHARARRRRRRAREDRVRLGHRLLVALPVLRRDLRLPHDPRPRAGDRDRAQAREPRARRLGRHRRRRRPLDRRQPLDARAAAQRRLQDPAVQQRDLRAHEGPVLADVAASARARRRAPSGSFDSPIVPGTFAIGAGAKFIARAIDVDKEGLGSVLEAAHGFDGAAFVEIFQNCIVYNDGVYNSFTDRDKEADAQLHVKHGEPLLFGADKSKGLAFDAQSMTLKVVDARANPGAVLVHDETNRTLAGLLVALRAAGVPGRARRDPAPARAELREVVLREPADEARAQRPRRGRAAPDEHLDRARPLTRPEKGTFRISGRGAGRPSATLRNAECPLFPPTERGHRRARCRRAD